MKWFASLGTPRVESPIWARAVATRTDTAPAASRMVRRVDVIVGMASLGSDCVSILTARDVRHLRTLPLVTFAKPGRPAPVAGRRLAPERRESRRAGVKQGLSGAVDVGTPLGAMTRCPNRGPGFREKARDRRNDGDVLALPSDSPSAAARARARAARETRSAWGPRKSAEASAISRSVTSELSSPIRCSAISRARRPCSQD